MRSIVTAVCCISCFPAVLCAAAHLESPTSKIDVEDVIREMQAAYAGIDDYQALVEVRSLNEDRAPEVQRFRYTFRKPGRIRLDFESPHEGMVIVYPDDRGRVLVRLAGLAHLLPLHLSPDNPLLMSSGGQRIDQTDLGLLIANIARSVREERRGELSVSEDERFIRIRVLAMNHFRRQLLTQYEFLIDRRLHLPVQVEESTPEGRLQRVVLFSDLRTNIGISTRFMEGG